MALFGLVGYPLGHSLSQQFFSDFFTKEQLPHRYQLFPLSDLNTLRSLLQRYPELCGLNVTIPYKEKVLSFVHYKDDAVTTIGASNCLKINKGIISAFNTDIYGFLYALKRDVPFLADIHNALILGSGGAAKAVRYALATLNIHAYFVSRTKNKGHYLYTELNENIIQKHRLIVQTTPLGMYPHTNNAPPFPYHLLGPQHIAYELIYNPETTLFLQRCATYGTHIIRGKTMLEQQALASWRIWKQ